MRQSRTSQTELARLSGIRQPSISQFLSGKTPLSDDQLDRLLSCMGYCLQVVRQPIAPDLTRSEKRSWHLHRQIARQLTPENLQSWQPTITTNLEHLQSGVAGEPHTTNVARWHTLLTQADLPGLHRVLTGLARDAIEMREVSPMSGILSTDERARALAEARTTWNANE
ncbi:MAG: helix-turn-helix domain-containing protein [Actinomycetia bacterium]|nr:helix-turn-helix domain-containing protein [Actinomycetes bacterium]